MSEIDLSKIEFEEITVKKRDGSTVEIKPSCEMVLALAEIEPLFDPDTGNPGEAINRTCDLFGLKSSDVILPDLTAIMAEVNRIAFGPKLEAASGGKLPPESADITLAR